MNFKKARSKMSKYLKKDEGLFCTYQSNIAMLLLDGFKDKRFTASANGFNAAAEEIMCLIFSIAPRLKEK